MKTKQVETLKALLEAMETFDSYIGRERYSIEFEIYNFQRLINKAEHKIEIYEMCIERLRQRFNKVLISITPY